MSRWPLVPLRDLTAEAVRPVAVQPEGTYRLLGVRTAGKGPFLRETKSGSEISAATLYRVAPGDFIYSRLFAWQGAFGVIPAEFEGACVSSEFPLFAVDRRRIDARYLSYWFRLPTTLQTVERDCTGTTPLTRNRYKEQFFANLLMPLPPLDIQHRAVAQVEGVTAKLASHRAATSAADAELAALLHAIFEVTTRGAPRAQMRDVAQLVRRTVEIELDGSYPELGIRSFGKGTFHKPSLGGSEVGTKRLFRIEAGDLLFNIVFAWEGAVAVAQAEDNGRCGSHRFLTCVPDPSCATSAFLRYYFLTPEGLQNLGNASPGGAGRNRTLGLKALEAIEVPVPPLEAQLRFDRLQSRAAVLRARHSEAEHGAALLFPSVLDRVFHTAPLHRESSVANE